MASGIVRGAMSSVLTDENLVKSTRTDEMKKFGREVLEICLQGDKEIEVFDQFSVKLTSTINLLFSEVKERNIKSMASKRTRCWSSFHVLRQDVLPKLWLDFFTELHIEVNYLFTQCVNQELFQQMLVTFFTEECKPVASHKEDTIVLTLDQLNALRYACGYVPHMLLKKYKIKTGAKAERFVRSLEKMAIGSENDANFYSYAKVWLEKVNRGGLFPLNDQHYELFVSIEKRVQAALPKHIKDKSKVNVSSLIDTIVKDEDVQFFWAMASQDIDSEEEADELLEEIIHKWVTVRGFAIAASWIEAYKNANEQTTQKATSLRKHLS